jgi:hypothetical protein
VNFAKIFANFGGRKRNNGKKYLLAFKVTGTISHLGSLKKATCHFGVLNCQRKAYTALAGA